MNFSNIRSSKLRNGEHAKFFTEVDNLIDESGSTALSLDDQSALFKSVLAREFEALGVIRKSALSDELEVADQPRDDTFRGTVDTAKAGLNHYDPEVRKAAAKVMVVLDSFGNVAALPYNEETIAISKIKTELTTKFANEVDTLGLAPWLTVLETQNTAFDTLMKERFSEEAGKTALRMKTIRQEVEAAYQKVLRRIEALIEINGMANYGVFVAEMNSRIEKYNTIVAQREGNKAEVETPKTALFFLIHRFFLNPPMETVAHGRFFFGM